MFPPNKTPVTYENTEVRGSIHLGLGTRQSNPRLWALNHSPKLMPHATWMPAALEAIPCVSTKTIGDRWSPGLSVTVTGDRQSGEEINHLIQNHTKAKPTGTSLRPLLLREVVSAVGSDEMLI